MPSADATSLQQLVFDASRRNARAGWHAHAFCVSRQMADDHRLDAALASAYSRYPILAARFAASPASGTLQIDVRDARPPEVYRAELGALDDAETIDAIAEHARQGHEPDAGGLFRLARFDCAGQIVVLARANHIAIDAHARQCILSAMLGGRLADGGSLARTWETQRRHVAWERDQARSDHRAQRVRDAQEMIDRHPPLFATSLSTDPGHPGLTMGPVEALDPVRTRQLHRLARTHRASAFTFVCAAFSQSLRRVTARDSHLVTLQYSTRSRVGAADAVDNFIDYLPIAVGASGSICDAGAAAGRSVQPAIRNFVPVRALSEDLSIDPNSGNPLLKVTANLQPKDDPSLNVFLGLPGDVRAEVDGPIRPLPLPLRAITLEMQDLGLIVGEYRDALRWRLTARADHVPPHAISSIAQDIGVFLTDAVERHG